MQTLKQKIEDKSDENVKKLCTQSKCEAFLSNRLQIRPSIIYFKETLRKILSIKNEHPKTLCERIKLYYDEIDETINALNDYNDDKNQIR